MVNRCCERVPGEGKWGSFHPQQCKRSSTVEREGKNYCGTHDPVAREARFAERYEQDIQRRKERQERDDFTAWAACVCRGVSVEKLRELGDKWLLSYLGTRND